MSLWQRWWLAVEGLRGACSRQRTFLWMAVLLAGLTIRTDVAGISSIIRALGLREVCYRSLLHLCHSSGLSLERLRRAWVKWVPGHVPLVRLGGRVVLIGDGLKVAKEGKKMPGVKKLHQSSQNNSKAAYIFGHSLQAVGILAGQVGRALCCLPLSSQIHEGVVFSNRDQRTLLDKFAALVSVLAKDLAEPVLLLADAYYASAKVLGPLLKAGHHVLTRVRNNAVAYQPAPKPTERRRGRPRVYGEKVRLRSLWEQVASEFQTAPSPVYGERNVTLSYYSWDLLWRPIGQLVRFVWVEHPQRGRMILLSTDLTLMPLQIIAGYSYRFKIELSFKHAIQVLGLYSYHFWMKIMSPRSRQGKNQYLHRTSQDYRRLVRRKLDAYHRFIQLGCIAQGLLQYLALTCREQVWGQFRSWLRTMNPENAPSEAVVAQALRNTWPQFLADLSQNAIFAKFILANLEPERAPVFCMAA